MTRTKIIRIIVPLLLSGIVAALTLFLVKDHVQYKEIYDDVAAWGVFFSVFGIVYAIIAGFLLVTVLSRYSNLNQTLEDELNAIETVRDFLTYLGDEQKEAKRGIKRALLHYATSLLDKEWAEMVDSREPIDSDTSEELYELMRKSKEIGVDSENDRIVFSVITETISDIAKLRTRRIALANDRLPPRLKLLLIFMSIIIVGSFVLLGVQNLYMHQIMLVSLIVSIQLLYMIIEDLDHPFHGIWNINRMPLEELVKRFNAEAS